MSTATESGDNASKPSAKPVKRSMLKKLRKFKIICEVCEVNGEIVEKGLNSSFEDFEDAIQYFTALQSNWSIIITRNGKNFKNASIPIVNAEGYLSNIR